MKRTLRFSVEQIDNPPHINAQSRIVRNYLRLQLDREMRGMNHKTIIHEDEKTVV